MRKTKAQLKAEQDATDRARISAALHWSDDADIAPDVLPPELLSNALSTGYTFNAYSRRVEVACSSSIHHAVGRIDKTTAQRPLALYSTRERALRAMRAALELEFATALAKIDREISQ